ncbi:MAG: HAD-IIB family hydrolase [Myxococcota bacterium]|nr:HAD-IIB family hydrolase [Myxococcota bacterium]
MPRPIQDITVEEAQGLKGVFCDIDDTLTWEGRLVPEAFAALARLQSCGLRVIPITGRPAGWVDHIARMWPVDGVVGENGGLWFFMSGGQLQRRFLQSPTERMQNRRRLDDAAASILESVPGTALASDQPYRELDLAVDFCEDVPALPGSAIDQIVEGFEKVGATCKVSSIHVNGWFGDFDKAKGCARFLEERFGEQLEDNLDRYAFFGDSANDEPLFATFGLSIGVANVAEFLPRMKTAPRFITEKNGGHGFAEGIARLLSLRGH